MNVRMYLLTNLLSGIMGMLMLAAGFWLFNILTPKWDFFDTFTRDKFNGGAVVVAAYLLSLAIIISRAAF